MDIQPDTDNAPTVALGGQRFAIPLLAARQNRVIDPLILGLLPVLALWQSDKAEALAALSGTHYEALQEIAFQAIRRARPDVTREQFLDLPVTLPELVAAFPVIAQQTGLFERTRPGEPSPGEAAAGAAPPQTSPTGTPSSPIPAT